MVRDSLVDQSFLFIHFYLMQGEKIEGWFVSPSSRKYFSVKPTAFLSAKNAQKIYPLVYHWIYQ